MVPVLIPPVGAVLSSIVMLALFPTFVPSVSLAYTVLPWSRLFTVTGLAAASDQLPSVVSFIWYCILKLVVVVNVILAFPPDHVIGLAVILPVSSPSSAPGTVAVVWFVNVPIPVFPALSPFTSTFISYFVSCVSPLNVYWAFVIFSAPLGVS